MPVCCLAKRRRLRRFLCRLLRQPFLLGRLRLCDPPLLLLCFLLEVLSFRLLLHRLACCPQRGLLRLRLRLGLGNSRLPRLLFPPQRLLAFELFFTLKPRALGLGLQPASQPTCTGLKGPCRAVLLAPDLLLRPQFQLLAPQPLRLADLVATEGRLQLGRRHRAARGLNER